MVGQLHKHVDFVGKCILILSGKRGKGGVQMDRGDVKRIWAIIVGTVLTPRAQTPRRQAARHGHQQEKYNPEFGIYGSVPHKFFRT